MNEQIVKKRRMPLLTIDEVILLVDTYFQLKEIKNPSVRKDIVQELSDNMRKLPLFPELITVPEFRSVSGMNMCLANVGYLDPDNPSKFGHGSALQKRVFDYYYDRRSELRRISIAINSVAKLKFPILPEYRDFIEGAILPSYHYFLENTDRTIICIKRDAVLNQKTICSICGEDLTLKYGEEAPLLLEPHLRKPLSSLRSEMQYSYSDIVMICPCCHKWAHLKPENYDLKQENIMP